MNNWAVAVKTLLPRAGWRQSDFIATLPPADVTRDRTASVADAGTATRTVIWSS
jgi:hypothetical protein